MAFLREPRPEREPIFQAPLSVVLLIALIIAVHLVRVLAPASFSEAMLERLAFIPARYTPLGHPGLAGTWIDGAIPFVGYIFLHANATHLIVNCLWLLAFGTPVARRFGALPFLLLFFLSGIAGAIAHLLGNWGSMDAAVGASGAIAGIMGAGIRLVWVGDPSLRPDGRMLPLTARQVLAFSGIWIAGNLLTGLTGLGTLPGLEHVAWQAHIGGYFAGLALSGPMDALFAPAETDAGIEA